MQIEPHDFEQHGGATLGDLIRKNFHTQLKEVMYLQVDGARYCIHQAFEAPNPAGSGHFSGSCDDCRRVGAKSGKLYPKSLTVHDHSGRA